LRSVGEAEVPGPQEVWGFLKGGRARLAIERRREPLEAATMSARRANAVGGVAGEDKESRR
jgi:hypothetical protein